MVELKRSTLKTYRYLWEAHAAPRLGAYALRDIDARKVVAVRGELLAAGVGPQSIVKTMSILQRVFRDAVEYGEVAFNPFKAVQKPSPGPARAAHPLTPLQVEQLAANIEARGYLRSAMLVRLMAYTGLRPQEALALHWYAVRDNTVLVELANADGELAFAGPVKGEWAQMSASRRVIAVFAEIALGPGGREGCGGLIRRCRAAGFRVRREEGQGGRAAS